MGSIPPSHVSGLTERQRVGLRMVGHDLNDDGKINGSVILKTLLNPEGSGNSAFLKTAESRNTVNLHLILDYFDDRQINGSSLRRDLAKTYKIVTGHDITQQLMSAPLEAAPLSAAELFKTQPSPFTREGLQQMVKDTGMSMLEIVNIALWGHDAIDNFGPNGRNLDGSALEPSLTDPNHLDFGMVNGVPGAKQYVQELINRDKANFGKVNGNALNFDFLKILERLLKIPGGIIGNR